MIAAVIILAALLAIVNMIRKRALELKYALAWIIVLILVLIVDLVPAILNVISYGFGIATPVNTLFLLAFCFSILLIFILTVTVSRLSDRIRQLSQAVALNEARIEQLARELAEREGQK
ncbi:MAG: DUF2304 domain-containing protein [Lachnospiraceae bacterium]|nr:DUF2304 domain-containing protein [Lachnospiraceae bacterium]